MEEILISDISFDELFMRQAYLIATKSKDPRSKIGSVLVKNNRVVSMGYNGFGSGVVDFKSRYEDRETKYQFVCHAEENSVIQCAKFGISSSGSTLYTQGVPCCQCFKILIQADVKKVICHRQWPNLTHSSKWVESTRISQIMAKEAGVEIAWLDKVLGVKGFLDGKEIDV